MPSVGRIVAIAVLSLAVGGCAMLRPRPAALPGSHQVALDQLVIHSSFELARQHRLLEEINSQRVDVSETLKLPLSDEPIHVYLFKDGEQYYDFIRRTYPNLPDRRAFFIETDTRLSVFAHWGDRVAEDLRHEVAHGYLHSTVRNLPLWLDEGLAEYFEVPRGATGMNAPHVAELMRLMESGRWQPDIQRLEAMQSPAEMSQADYAESWAWVHWMLQSRPNRKVLLREYLSDLRTTGVATPLSLYLRHIESDPNRELAVYVRGLAEQQKGPPNGRSLQLQDVAEARENSGH